MTILTDESNARVHDEHALRIAAQRGSVNDVQTILHARRTDPHFNVNALDGDHKNALHHAAPHGNDRLNAALVGAGIDMSHADRHGKRPRDYVPTATKGFGARIKAAVAGMTTNERVL